MTLGKASVRQLNTCRIITTGSKERKCWMTKSSRRLKRTLRSLQSVCEEHLLIESSVLTREERKALLTILLLTSATIADARYEKLGCTAYALGVVGIIAALRKRRSPTHSLLPHHQQRVMARRVLTIVNQQPKTKKGHNSYGC